MSNRPISLVSSEVGRKRDQGAIVNEMKPYNINEQY